MIKKPKQPPLPYTQCYWRHRFVRSSLLLPFPRLCVTLQSGQTIVLFWAGASVSPWPVLDGHFQLVVTPLGILLLMTPGCCSPAERKYWTGVIFRAVCDRAEFGSSCPLKLFCVWCRRQVNSSWVLVWASDTTWRCFGDSLRLITQLLWWHISLRISGDLRQGDSSMFLPKWNICWLCPQTTSIWSVPLRCLPVVSVASHLLSHSRQMLEGAVPVPSLSAIKWRTWYFSSSQ